MLQELSCVTLMVDLPEAGLHKGDVGTIVLAHRDGEAYEVEFGDENGKTLAIRTLYPAQIQPFTAKKSWGDHIVPFSMFLIVLYNLYIIDATVRMVHPLWPGTWIRPMAFVAGPVFMGTISAAILGIGGAIYTWKESQDRIDRVIAIMSFALGLSVLPVFSITIGILVRIIGFEMEP